MSFDDYLFLVIVGIFAIACIGLTVYKKARNLSADLTPMNDKVGVTSKMVKQKKKQTKK